MHLSTQTYIYDHIYLNISLTFLPSPFLPRSYIFYDEDAESVDVFIVVFTVAFVSLLLLAFPLNGGWSEQEMGGSRKSKSCIYKVRPRKAWDGEPGEGKLCGVNLVCIKARRFCGLTFKKDDLLD